MDKTDTWARVHSVVVINNVNIYGFQCLQFKIHYFLLKFTSLRGQNELYIHIFYLNTILVRCRYD